MRFDEARRRSGSALPTGPSVTRAPTRRESWPLLPARLGPGDTLGGYLIIDEITCGSHSSVYRAEERRGSQRVALKVLASRLAISEDAGRRFDHEIELARRVEHPGLVPVLDAGEDRGYAFFTMPLEIGSTLEDLAFDAPFHRELAFFVDIATRLAPVARAVHALHASGIIHRDIKPANILLGHGGRLLLGDFGSALDVETARTRSEQPGGTVLYMAPEQLLPGADPTDPRGDVYALGATLYEAVTGSAPFPPVADADLARLKLTRSPPPARRIHPHVPIALDALVRRAMAEPSLRSASAAEFARDLERFASRHLGGGRAK